MNGLDYIIIVLYILAFLLFGRLFKESKSGDDYFLGGKSFGWGALSLSTVATQLSAISFISAPAFVGLREGGGLIWLTYELAVPLAMLFLMLVLIPPLYKAGIVSVYQYLEERYSVSTRILLSTVFQVSRAFATSVMVYTVALILTSVMDIPMWQTILIIGVVTLVYSYQGGMKAVVYGDVVQMIILFGGIIICLVAGVNLVGGWSAFIDTVETDRLTAINFQDMGLSKGSEFGFFPMLIGGFFLYASYYGTDQSQVQRLFSAKDQKTVRQTLVCNGLMRFPITLTYCVMGLVIGTAVLSNPSFRAAIPADKPDMMMPIFIRDYLPHGIIGILMVAIFSAAMSSLSSAINSLSAASVEDYLNRDGQLSDEEHVRYSKYAALFWGILCIVLAFFTGDIADTVIEAINKIGSVFYGPILATFFAAICVKTVNSKGINVGILVGVAVNVYLWLFVPEVFWFWWNAIGAVTTLAVAYLASRLMPSQEIQAETDSGDWSVSSSSVLLLVGMFVLIVVLSYFMPSIFG